MRLGFNWELGPFELWDAAGVEATVARMKKEGKPVAANVERLLAAGQKTWYATIRNHPPARKYWELGKSRTGSRCRFRRSLVGDCSQKIQWRGEEKLRRLGG